MVPIVNVSSAMSQWFNFGGLILDSVKGFSFGFYYHCQLFNGFAAWLIL
jgi:hypothetical protein